MFGSVVLGFRGLDVRVEIWRWGREVLECGERGSVAEELDTCFEQGFCDFWPEGA